MKDQKKKEVTAKEIREYLKDQGTDQKKLTSLHRLTAEGKEKISNVISHFSGAKPHKAGIRLELGDDKVIETGGLGEMFDTTHIIDVDTIKDRINEVIDFRNYAIEQVKEILPETDLFIEEEKKKQHEIMQKGIEQIDHLNAIVKQKGILHPSDMKFEVLEPIIEMRLRSREFIAIAEQRRRQLEKLKKEKEQSKDQEPER